MVSEFPQVSAELLNDVQGVLLDLDNTLYCYDRAHKPAKQKALEFLANQLNSDVSLIDQTYTEQRKKLHKQLKDQAASHHRLLYFQRIVEKLQKETHFELTSQVDSIYWREYLSQMTLLPGALEFLKTCYRNKIPICILTDYVTHVQYQKIEKLSIQKYITFLVSSEEVGVEKPDARMFDAGLEKLNLKPEQVLMIGDNKVKDGGAEKLGIKFVLVESF